MSRMTLEEFDALVGQDSYVRCLGKKRLDQAIVSSRAADDHVFSGGQIGWWVRSGYIVVDIDEGKEQALEVIKRLKLKTLICKTPKGLHLYFKCDKEYPQKVGMVLPCGLKCDFRCANKGYVLLPFGAEERRFNKIRKIAELPPEFTPLINRKESLLGLKDGDGRNATLFAHLMAYKNRGATDDQIEKMAGVINEVVFAEPMDQEELDKIVSNTHKYEASQQFDNPYLVYNSKGVPTNINHRAICDYFVNRGDTFVLGGECYQYNEGVYSESSSRVRNTIKDMISVDNLITQNRIMECFRLICDDVRLQRTADELNRDRNLINFQNGVWDIERQVLMPHDSKYLMTIQIPHKVAERVKFKDTRLFDFFKQTRLPKGDVMMLMKYLAYCMTTDYGLKTFMILVGQSNTGKSVLIRFFESLVGEQNVSSLSMHELNMRFYPSQLYNRLINSCADNSSLPLSSIDNLKKITGGDRLMHEKKGKEPFFFVPFSKLIFSFNQLPLQLEEKSNAFYKRMRILYMNTELFLNNDYVNDLCSNEGVEEIIPYLLSLLPVKSIPRTDMSNRLVESLRQDSDSIHAFLTKRCNLSPDASITKDSLYESYCRFCVDNGRESHKKHAFMRILRSQGLRETRHPKTREYLWVGVELRKDGE